MINKAKEYTKTKNIKITKSGKVRISSKTTLVNKSAQFIIGSILLILILILGAISIAIGLSGIFMSIWSIGFFSVIIWNFIYYWKNSSWMYVLITPFLSWTYFIL